MCGTIGYSGCGCCCPNPPAPFSTCPRLALVGTFPSFPVCENAPTPLPCRPPPRKCLVPWIPVSRNRPFAGLNTIVLDEPAITRIYEVRHFNPIGSGSFPPYCTRHSRVMPRARCAGRLIPSKFMTMA